MRFLIQGTDSSGVEIDFVFLAESKAEAIAILKAGGIRVSQIGIIIELGDPNEQTRIIELKR